MPALLLAALLLLPSPAFSANDGQNNNQSGGGQQMFQSNPNTRYGDVAHPDKNAGVNPNGSPNSPSNQNGNVSNDGQVYPGVWSGLNGPKETGGKPSAPFSHQAEADMPDAPEKPAGPVSTQDARDNFPTLIENYLATGRGRRLHLKLISIDPESVAPAGRSRYTAKAKLKSRGIKDPVTLYFTGDFTGAEWKVVAHSFTKPANAPALARSAKKKRKKRR